MASRASQGPQFVRYFGPLIEALKELGGSGRPSEVQSIIVRNCHVSEEEQNAVNKGGVSRFGNQVAWARFYLVRAGYVEASQRGVWSLTTKGASSTLDNGSALAVFKAVQKLFKTGDDTPADETPEDTEPVENSAPRGYKEEILHVLRNISPAGFERLCQRLLREAGFQEVTVTGRSNDGGIDGIGRLQINAFVSFTVLFQCKRYVGSVSSDEVRKFRGAMSGRAEKGIVLTTGAFTSEARKEASRDGVPPIQLVDSDDLIKMLEDLELGLVPKTTYDVDHAFFDEFAQ